VIDTEGTVGVVVGVGAEIGTEGIVVGVIHVTDTEGAVGVAHVADTGETVEAVLVRETDAVELLLSLTFKYVLFVGKYSLFTVVLG